LMGSHTGPQIADASLQARVLDTILTNTYQIFDEDWAGQCHLDTGYVDDDGLGIYLHMALDFLLSDRVFLAFLKIPLSFLCDPKK
jgi:phage major head subunit gpT-like protein